MPVLQAVAITPELLPRVKTLYEDFCACAQQRYHWHSPPADFETFCTLIGTGQLQGLVVVDNAADPRHTRVEAFMLYVVEAHRAIEINVVHFAANPNHGTSEGGLLPPNWQTVFDVLMQGFLKAIALRNDWDAVSYAMLGAQEELVQTAPWYGLEPVGQAIQQFDMMNEISLPILQKVHSELPILPLEYELTHWPNTPENSDTMDDEAMAACIYESFKKSKDALWDPRFASVTGAKAALQLMTSGQMGLFRPEWQSILWKGTTPVGFCFLIQVSELEANIALIGIHPSERRKGEESKKLGQQVLRHALVNLVKGIAQQQWLISHVSTTLDTDNIPAIHLYRRFGFQEVEYYPHCYLTRHTAAKAYYGKRYFAESQQNGCCGIQTSAAQSPIQAVTLS